MVDPNFELTFNEYLNSEQPEHQLSPICNEFENSLSEQNSKDSGSMNMDEFLKWMAAEDNNKAQGTTTAATIPVQQQLNLQENNVSTQKTTPVPSSQQPTFGNMLLEDFSVWAGVGEEPPNYAQLALPHQPPPQQLQAPQHLPPLQYIPPQPQQQPVSSNRRKRNSGNTSEEVEKRQKRMIKHRETAAKNRAKKQAHVVELEEKLIRLTKENRQLKQNLAWLENIPNFQYCEEEETTAKAPMQPKSPKANKKSTELRRCFSSPY